MEITSHIVDTPPRDAATVLMLREGSSGLEVLLLKRHTDSKDLGGAFVFPVPKGSFVVIFGAKVLKKTVRL